MKGALAIADQLERSDHISRYISPLWVSLGYLLVLLLNGAIPFLMAPTMGQLVWLSGFAGSISNGGLVSPYVHNAGWPTPAIVSFGLSGAWPMAALIRLGFSYVDAYTLVFALWLTLAYWGARRAALALGNGSKVATLAAVSWLTLPLIWAHQSYSMLAIGFALVPTYLLPVVTRVFDPREPAAYARDCLVTTLAALVAAFTDGYTFFFFASAALVLLPGKALLARRSNIRGISGGLFAWIVAIGTAYMSFRWYMGNTAFPPAELPFFRSYALDPAFLLQPQQGTLWLADRLHLSAQRDPALFFGDASIRNTSFLLPITLLAATTFVLARRRPRMAWLALFVAIVAMYLALGPSLKWNTMRAPGEMQVLFMPADAGILDMRSAWLFENVPGLQNMRATYRWSGLFAYACWLIALITLPHVGRRTHAAAIGALVALVALNLPHLSTLHGMHRHREMVLQMDRSLVLPLESELRSGERLAVLPWGNDFAVNYLAARLDLRAFNVGGDKNYPIARLSWPEALRSSEMNRIDSSVADRTLTLLLKDEADVVMLAFFDPLWDAHAWPPSDHRRGPMQGVLAQLRNNPLVTVQEFPHYAIVRRDARLNQEDALGVLDATTLGCLVPDCLRVSARDHHVGTQVGTIDGSYLRSTGRSGYLMFGPYQPLNAGVYQLTVYGDTEHLSGGTLDIVDSGNVIRSSTALDGPAPGVLFLGNIELNKAASQLEVRIFTAAGDQVRVRGYQLHKRSCEPPHCLQIAEFHDGSMTQGGRPQDGWLHSTGQRGFLVYGPYSSLAAGDYELELYGDAKDANGTRVELVSDQSKLLHARFSLPPALKGPFSLKQRLKLAQDVKGAEVRVWVEPTDVLSVRGLRLRQVGSEKSP